MSYKFLKNLNTTLIFIICFIISFQSSYCQNTPVKTYGYNNNVLDIKITVSDSVYNYNDTCMFNIDIRNISKKNIYIVDRYDRPKIHYSNCLWLEKESKYIYNFGEYNTYNLDFHNYLQVEKLLPEKVYSVIVKRFLDIKNKSTSKNGVVHDWNANDVRTLIFDFFFGYLKDSSIVDFDKKDKDGWVQLKDNEEEFYEFGKIFDSVYVGPIWVRVH